MPSYNSSSFIEDSIKSVILQSYNNWELLITDDYSSDNTFEIINKYAYKDNRIKVFRLEVNSGAGVARNNSINHANGEFIAFLDSDDQWLPQKLEKQIMFMIKNDLSLTYTDYSIINENQETLGIFRSPSKLNYKKMLRNDYIGFLTVVFNSNKLGKQFLPQIRKRQDWALLLKILKQIDFAYGLPEVLSIYKKRDSSISSKKYKLIKYIWSVYRETERLSFIRSIYYIIAYPFNYFRKQSICFSKIF